MGDAATLGVAPGSAAAWRDRVLAAALLVPVPVAAAGPCSNPAPNAAGIVLDRDLGGGRLLCLRADPEVLLDEGGGIAALPEGRRLAVAVAAGEASRSLVIRRVDGATLYGWEVDGHRAPFDDAAREWLEDALAVVGAIREGDRLRAEAESRAAEIASLVEDERRLRDEIGGLLEERGRLQREMGAIRAEERELRNRMESLRGEESALRVAAGDHGAAIASLTAELEQAEASRRDEIEVERTRRRTALDAVLEQLRSEDHPRRIRDLEGRLDDLETDARVGAIEARIAELNVDERVGDLEERIRRLQVRERSAALRRRVSFARERLEDLRRRTRPRIERLAPEVPD